MSSNGFKGGAGRGSHRIMWMLCLLGVGYATWEAGRLIGRNEAARNIVKGNDALGGGPVSVSLLEEDAATEDEAPPLHMLPNEDGPVPVSLLEEAAATEDEASPPEQDTDRLHPDRFWKAYAADRYSLLTRGIVVEEAEAAGEGIPPSTADVVRVRPTKYLVFQKPPNGLGSHMSGMMSAFVLSLATERVFLHSWVQHSTQVAARYDQIFVPPFSPWNTSAATGTAVSGPGGRSLGSSGGHRGRRCRQVVSSTAGTLQQHFDRIELGQAAGVVLGRGGDGTVPLESPSWRADGVLKGYFNEVFIDKRGRDPRPDCPVLFVTSNQFLVEIMLSPAYGSSKVGGTLISDWLQAGSASKTLFAGLLRPVATIERRVAEESARLFPAEGQTMAAHARCFHLGSRSRNTKFLKCVERLALSNNVSTVLLATDAKDFQGFAQTRLEPKGVRMISMEGVERLGEGAQMRNTLQKIQLAVTEMFLVGKADIVVTSPRSSFSGIAAAREGESTQRFGGMTCERLVNDPEFHSLECAKNEWRVDQLGNPAVWDELYDFVDSNRKRCKG